MVSSAIVVDGVEVVEVGEGKVESDTPEPALHAVANARAAIAIRRMEQSTSPADHKFPISRDSYPCCWATAIPASQPGARPPLGGVTDVMSTPAWTSSQEMTEFEFHISLVFA